MFGLVKIVGWMPPAALPLSFTLIVAVAGPGGAADLAPGRSGPAEANHNRLETLIVDPFLAQDLTPVATPTAQPTPAATAEAPPEAPASPTEPAPVAIVDPTPEAAAEVARRDREPASTPQPTATPRGVAACDESDEYRFEVDDDDGEVEVRGAAVISVSASTLVIGTPDGTKNVLLNADTDIDGNLNEATEVRVRGVMDGPHILASKVDVRCPDD